MKNKMNFLWIDDNPGRKSFEYSINNYVKKGILMAKVKFINVKNKKLSEEIAAIKNSKSKPCLIIIDHVLNQTQDKIIKEGSTVAEIFRHEWPTCPVVGITGAEKRKDINFYTESMYEDLYTISNLSTHYDSLFILAHTFKYLSRKKPKQIEQLIKLFNPPNDDIDRLSSIIPDDIKNKLDDDSLLIRISKWVRQILFKRPGFLYDRLYTATFLGIKEDSFSKIEKLFMEAKYNGIFEDYDGPRWWVSKVIEKLYKIISSPEPSQTWELGRKLPRIKRGDYSECYVCNGQYDKPPEIIGYIDVESNERKPMHLRCSVPHPKFEKSLYFDEIRMMKAAK